MRSLKVKLVHCGNVNIVNKEDRLQKNVFFIPLGLFSLANILKEQGIDIEIIHLDIESNQELEDILDFENIDAIGFDCHWANQSLSVMNTAEYIKKRYPRVFIFLGGFTASLFAKEIIDNFNYIDAVLRGDSEKPIAELCDAISQMKEEGQGVTLFSKVSNLTWRTEENVTVLNDITYVATNEEMNSFEFANYELLRNWEIYRDLSRYYTNFSSIASYPQFLLCIGRGCVYNCSFCGGNSKSQIKMNNRKGQILRDVNSVIKNIEKGINYGFEFFYSSFDTQDSDKWYIQLFEKLKKKGIKTNFGYNCWRLPTKGLVDSISYCCNEALLEFSPETGVESLRHANKDKRLSYSNQELEEMLDYIKTKDNVKVQLWFGYFLPFETEESVYATFTYISKLYYQYSDIIEVIYDNFSTDPGSLFFYEPDKFDIDIQIKDFRGYLKSISENYISTNGATPDLTKFRPKGISKLVSDVLAVKIRLFNYLYIFYKKSVCYLQSLDKNNFEFIADYIKVLEIDDSYKEDFNTLQIKEVLIKIADFKSGLSTEFEKILNAEYNATLESQQLQSSQFFSKRSIENNSELTDPVELIEEDDVFIL